MPGVEMAGTIRRSFIDEARREQIVNCTIEVLAEVGFARTSLAEIAKRAGISKGVISYHFAGKKELIEQVLEKSYREGREWLTLLAEKEGLSPSQKLRIYIDSNVNFLRTQPAYIKALMEIYLNYRNEDGSPLDSVGYDDTTQQFLEELFREGQATGIFRQFSPSIMAVSLRAALDIVPLQMQFDPELNLDAYAAEIAETFDRATRAS